MKFPQKLFNYLGFLLIIVSITLLISSYWIETQEIVTIYVVSPQSIEPTTYQVQGNFHSVGDVLAYAGILLNPHDIVTPSLNAPAPAATKAITIQKAHKIVVTIEDNEQSYWTLQTNLGNFLAEQHFDIRPAHHLFADGKPITPQAFNDTPIPNNLTIVQDINITIQDGTERWAIQTEVQTVSEALQEAGIALYAVDKVSPNLNETISPNMTISIQRSIPVTIYVDGKVIQTRSQQNKVLNILAGAGIGLVGADYTVPASHLTLGVNKTIQVIRVTEDFMVIDEPIPYQTTWVGSDQFEIDTTGLVQQGIAGIQRQRIRIRYENGVEVSRTPDGSWIAAEPINEILGYGTQIIVRTLDTPEGTLEYWRKVRMRVTSYTAATSGKDFDHPAYGITASGVPAGKGVVAVDRTIVPWRSDIYVSGYGIGFVGDTGGGIIGRWIDLGYDESNFEWWAGYTDVYYLTPVPDRSRINYRLPAYLP